MRPFWLRRGIGASLRPSRGLPRGQSLVEFALVLPVIMLILLITIDFGRLFMSYVSLNNTVRVAANFGSTSPDSFTGTPSTGTYDAVVGAEAASLTGTCPIRSASSYNPPLPTYPSGSDLGAVSQASMTCDFSFLTPFMNSFFGGSLPISASAQFPVRTGALADIGGGGIPAPGSPVASFNFINVSGGTIDGSGNVVGAAGQPVTVNFQDASSNAQTWDWSFGDSQADWTTDASPPAHTYPGSATVQTYTVTLTVSNSSGLTSSLSRTVTVEPAAANPVAGFYGNPVGSAPQVSGGGPTFTPIDGTVSTTVNFINTSTGATGYSWNFGDGSAADTSATPNHTYSALGIYNVTLSITSPTGSSPLTRSGYVTVGCVVPNFVNHQTSDAASMYASAGLTGTLWYQKQGSSSASKSAPNVASNIQSQTGQNGGVWVMPTKQGSHPYGCNYDVTVVYQ